MARACRLAGLVLCIPALLSCSKKGGDAHPAAPASHKTYAGVLKVDILPDTPTSLQDLQVVASGGGGTVSYSWEKNGAEIPGAHTARLTRDHYAKGDSITADVRMGDEKGSVTVSIGNAPPVVRSLKLSPGYIVRGVDITALPQAYDRDGDAVTFDYAWSVNGEEIVNNSPTLRGNTFKRGDTISLVVTPRDSEGATGPPFTIVPITVPNAQPLFVSTPPQQFKGTTYTYDAVAKDPDGDPIQYSLASAPQGMTIDPGSGRISWQVTRESAGVHEVKVVARDPEGAQSEQQYSLTISLNDGEGP